VWDPLANVSVWGDNPDLIPSIVRDAPDGAVETFTVPVVATVVVVVDVAVVVVVLVVVIAAVVVVAVVIEVVVVEVDV
jgi:hypothetical protein